MIFRKQLFPYRRIEDIEEELQTFDVIFCGYPFKRVANVLSFLIRFFQKLRYGYEASSFSHVAIVSKEKDVNGDVITYVYEANPHIRKLEFKEWINRQQDVCIEVYRLNSYAFNMVQPNHATAWYAMRLNLGKRYDYISLLVYQVIYSITGVWVGNRTSNAFYCSEYVAYILSHLTNSKELHKWWSISPAGLYHILNRNGFNMRTRAYLNNK